MIVHHRVGEKLSGLMSRQYRTTFNGAAAVTAGLGSPLTGIFVAHPFFYAWPAGVALIAYAANLVARFNRVKPYELKPPTKLTEDQVLELQYIYFHVPKEYRAQIEKLLTAAYEQIERGNIDAVNPRLEAARTYRAGIVSYNTATDQRQDVIDVLFAAKAMRNALTAGPSASAEPEQRHPRQEPLSGTIVDSRTAARRRRSAML